MSNPEISLRELRNEISRILREVEAGASFTVTVHGRPVARLAPNDTAGYPRRLVDRETLLRTFTEPPDEAWAADLAAMRAPERSGSEPRS